MIVLYSTGCPKCEVLKSKLDEANVEYVTVSDVQTILDAGIDIVPVLEIDGIKMNFMTAVNWLAEREKQHEH